MQPNSQQIEPFSHLGGFYGLTEKQACMKRGQCPQPDRHLRERPKSPYGRSRKGLFGLGMPPAETVSR
jgi:hypothetical protein